MAFWNCVTCRTKDPQTLAEAGQWLGIRGQGQVCEVGTTQEQLPLCTPFVGGEVWGHSSARHWAQLQRQQLQSQVWPLPPWTGQIASCSSGDVAGCGWQGLGTQASPAVRFEQVERGRGA